MGLKGFFYRKLKKDDAEKSDDNKKILELAKKSETTIEVEDKDEDVSELRLIVGELTQREEFGKGFAKIDSDAMQEIGIKEGDIIEIEGRRKTPAIAVKSYPADSGLNIVRMDGLVRRNAGTGVGNNVKVRKVELKEAIRVSLAPAQEGTVVQVSSNLIKKYIYNRPLSKGDIIVPLSIVNGKERDKKNLPNIFQEWGINIDDFFSNTPTGETRFIVTNTEPAGVVKITDMTEVEILSRLPSDMLKLIKTEESTEEDLLRKAKIINVKTLPNLENMLELKDLYEVVKLANQYYINRYEDKKQIIYFAEKWYFRKLKKINKTLKSKN